MTDCKERDRLSGKYVAATSAYLRAVELLDKRIGVMVKGDYETIKRAAEEARLRSEQLRIALENHVEEHGCSAEDAQVGAG
jgi:hypothetical protein